MKHIITFVSVVVLIIGFVAPVYAGGGMNCGFGSWSSPDETIRLFPTYAVADPSEKKIRIPVHVWIHERERDRMRQIAIKALARSMDLEKETPEYEIFEKRMVDFMVDNERGKKVKVWVEGDGIRYVYDLFIGETPANGHLFAEVTVPMKSKKAPDSVELKVGFDDSNGLRPKMIRVPVVPKKGVTVVSDIDDTIKITNVLDKSEMVANTFTREFRPVPGMTKYFDKWNEQGARFHYLSASPWNLQSALQKFADDHGFPSGVYHLRVLRLKDIGNTIDFVSGSEPHKLGTLRKLMKDFPGREFILVGDSGEKDPEIYGKITREFPGRVRQILIRKVPGAANDDDRFEKAFAEVPAKVWSAVTPTE